MQTYVSCDVVSPGERARSCIASDEDFFPSPDREVVSVWDWEV